MTLLTADGWEHRPDLEGDGRHEAHHLQGFPGLTVHLEYEPHFEPPFRGHLKWQSADHDEAIVGRHCDSLEELVDWLEELMQTAAVTIAAADGADEQLKTLLDGEPPY